MSVSARTFDPNELAAADRQSFEERLAALRAGEANLEKAARTLRLGQEAEDAYAAAQGVKADAVKTLADARDQAAEIIKQAQAEADQILTAATERRRSVLRELRSTIDRIKTAAPKEPINVEI